MNTSERYPALATRLDNVLAENIRFESIANAIWKAFDEANDQEAYRIVEDLEKHYKETK